MPFLNSHSLASPLKLLVKAKLLRWIKKVTFTWNAQTHDGGGGGEREKHGTMLRCWCVSVWVCVGRQSLLWRNVSCRGKIEISIEFKVIFLRSLRDFLFYFILFSRQSLNVLLFLPVFFFSFCHFQRLATMAAISQWSRNSASHLRKRKSKDHLSASSNRMNRWMWWVASSIGCVCRRRKMCTRVRDVVWLRQLKVLKTNGECITQLCERCRRVRDGGVKERTSVDIDTGNLGFCKCHQHFYLFSICSLRSFPFESFVLVINCL